MLKITGFFLGGQSVSVLSGTSVFLALKLSGLGFARFCFHETLFVAGNCRACLLEVQNFDKPLPSCVADLEPGQGIWTESLFTQKCKENIFESLLANHPLDCPICDQAGECDLQDQAKIFGGDRSRFFANKRGVFDKNCHFLVKAIMTRCIHCTRCVRFNLLLENRQLGILLRGTASAIGNYVFKPVASNLFGNVIDLCPVGALTARAQAFSVRPWETKIIESLDLLDGFGSNIYLYIKETQILKILPKPNKLLNGNFISDNCRFSHTISKNKMLNTYFFNTRTQNNEIISWKHWFKKTDKVIKENKVLFLLEKTISCETIDFIKKICNKSTANALFYLDKKLNTNFYNTPKNNLNLLCPTKICNLVLFAVNLKVEAALLNFKLKIKFKKQLFSIFNFGANNFNNSINFIGCNIKNTQQFLEGKISSINFSLNTIYIQGKSFMSKSFDLNFYSGFLQEKIKSLKIITVKLFSNEEGANLLNLKSCSLKHTYIIFSIQNKTTILLRNSFSDKVFWFNTSLPVNLKLYSSIPLHDTSVIGGTFFSQKIQQAKKISQQKNKFRSMVGILAALFNFTEANFFSFQFITFISSVLNPELVLSAEKTIKKQSLTEYLLCWDN